MLIYVLGPAGRSAALGACGAEPGGAVAACGGCATAGGGVSRVLWRPGEAAEAA